MFLLPPKLPFGEKGNRAKLPIWENEIRYRPKYGQEHNERGFFLHPPLLKFVNVYIFVGFKYTLTIIA